MRSHLIYGFFVHISKVTFEKRKSQHRVNGQLHVRCAQLPHSTLYPFKFSRRGILKSSNNHEINSVHDYRPTGITVFVRKAHP